MTPQQIIDGARIPETRSVLVLGSFEKRVTVYSQQVRALNLVDAMLSTGLVRSKGKVAIIGGGVAGITAGVALAKARPDLAQLDLFESRTGILVLQHGSRRYLHPHLYEWPALGAERFDAGLPIMNWSAGPAGDVAAALRREFEEAIHSSLLKLHASKRVSGLKPSPLGSVRVLVGNDTAISRIYDVVVLAIGFGLESHLDGETPSYWTPSELAAPILAQMQDPTLFISGNGDGGLVDFVMAALNGLDHREICELLMGLELGDALLELKTIEQEAWAGGADIDLLIAYRTRVRPLIPAAVWAQINDNLRHGVRIRLHTREQRLLRRTTALHNRLLAFLVLETDREMGHNAITVTVGVDFVGAVPSRGDVHLEGEAPFHPFRRFLRLGPDADTNLAPFADLLSVYISAVPPPTSATRPEPTILTATARTLFEGLQTAGHVGVSRAPPIPSNRSPVESPHSIALARAAPGFAQWSGDVGPGAIDQVWSTNRAIAFYCDIDAPEGARLAPAIARLAAHAHSFVLYARDVVGWQAALSALCAGKTLPAPDLDIRCVVEDWRPPPALSQHLTGSLEDLAAAVQVKLDHETLRQLHAALYTILGPAAVAIGWPIESSLRERLWVLWEQWHTALVADDGTRRRFQRLAANESDRVDSDDAELVRIGPKIIRPYLTKPAIFALAFSLCSHHPMVPAARHPGNIVEGALTGHSCGVSWIKERTIGAYAVAQHAWTTSVVLLSHLRDAVRMIEGDVRMDRLFSEAASVGVISAGEEPLIIGADETFVNALEAGEAAVQEYLQSIFRWRVHAARQALEEGTDDNP